MVNAATKNGSSNGVHPDAATISEQDLLWGGLPPTVIKELEQPLGPALVSQRKGRAGRTYAYIEGRIAIQQANRILGFGGWGYEVVNGPSLQVIESVDSKTGEVRQTHAYTATVRVNVPGVPSRTDVGFHTVAEESAEGHETAYKGSVTDGLKRALRTFGDQLGNALYGEGVPDAIAPSLRQTLIDLGMTQGFDEGQVRAAVKSKTGKDLDQLPASELTPLVEGAARKIQQSSGAEAKEAA